MRPLSLYIHWPFCKSKCPYCDFNSHVRESVDQAAWQQALLAELRWTATQIPRRPLVSIFFGGGTPSLMPPATVAALLEEAEALFGFTPEIEITLEANPTSVEIANFRALAQAGVNRVSIGVQSFDPVALTFLGREHSPDEAKRAIDSAAECFSRYSFDLIYALPEQRPDAWAEELESALTLARGHLSLYQLTIEPGTQFFHHHKAGKFIMPEGDLAAEFYQQTQAQMEAAGMPAYEISNHAAAGQESRHNVNYWQSGDYIGIGPGAHGRLTMQDSHQRHATYQHRSPEKWLEQVHQHGHGQEEALALTTQEQLEEAVMMGLRLREGLRMEWLQPLLQPAGITSFDTLWPQAIRDSIAKEGLATFSPDVVTPSATGRLVLNSLITHLAQHLVLPDLS